MAEYDPPIYDVPVFNPAFFINEDEITKGYLRANFLEFPIGQGLETLPDLRIENDKIHLGTNSISTGTNSISIGTNATTSTNDSAIAIGNGASSAIFSTSLGSGSNSSGNGSLSCGVSSTSSGKWGTALGRNTIASGESSVAIGNGAVATEADEIQLGTSASKLNLKGRLNLFNTTTTSLITYTNAVKMYRQNNGLTIGNYGEFAVQIADTTDEPTSVPTTRAGVNFIKLEANGNTKIGNENNNSPVYLRTSQNRVVLSGYSTQGTMSLNANKYVIVSSDRRLKENIETYDEPSIEKIMKLKPAYYNWIDDKSKKKELGFIAQDVETIIPEAVDGKKYEYEWEKDEDGEPILDASGNLQFTDKIRYRGFSDRPLIAVLVKAVQEQQEQINMLKERISYLNI